MEPGQPVQDAHVESFHRIANWFEDRGVEGGVRHELEILVSYDAVREKMGQITRPDSHALCKKAAQSTFTHVSGTHGLLRAVAKTA